MHVILIEVIVVIPLVCFFSDSFEWQNEYYLNEFEKIKLEIEKNIGLSVVTEKTIVKFEEVPTDEFIVSEQVTLTDELQEFLWYICKIYNLDYYLVLAIIDVESGFNSNALSLNNYGLMQINEINHTWLEAELMIDSNFLNPYNNILAGCYMLSEISKKYEQYNEILLVYNLGETGASRLFSNGIYNTSYTSKVYNKYYFYGGENYI